MKYRYSKEQCEQYSNDTIHKYVTHLYGYIIFFRNSYSPPMDQLGSGHCQNRIMHFRFIPINTCDKKHPWFSSDWYK